jgi:RNA-directed DNA polymerase
MNTAARAPLERWDTIPWQQIQRAVFKLHTRMYQAARRGAVGTVRRLHRLVMTSWSATRLAVRKVTQANPGKRTAGIEGVKALMPAQR